MPLIPTVVGIFFDPEMEDTIRQAWAHVAAKAGLPNKLGEMANGRPHLSLGIYQDGQTKKILSEVADLAKGQKPFEIRFESYGIFDGSRGILFLGPAPNEPLLAVHRAFQKRVGGLAAQWVEYYLPDKLVFHCSLTVGLDKAQLLRALEAALGLNLPLIGNIESIGLLRDTRRAHRDSFAFSA